MEDNQNFSKHELKRIKRMEREKQREEIRAQHESELRAKKTKKYVLISAVILVVLVLAFIFLRSISKVGTYTRDNILDLNLKEHKSVSLHIHPVLEIEILGEKQEIPTNIGVSSSGMRVIHTHEPGGTIHVESPYPQEFYLKDFFTVWGRNFNSTCIFEYCTDEGHKLSVFVNGLPNEEYGELILRDGDIIKIVYDVK